MLSAVAGRRNAATPYGTERPYAGPKETRVMVGRRDDRQERREERGPGAAGAGGNRYQMRQKMVSIGDDFWIENAQGQRVYKVDGKALRVRQTLAFEDAQGRELCRIQERMVNIKDTMEVEDAAGNQVAVVRKALISPVRDRFVVKVRNGPDLEVKGNLLDHEYTIGEGRDKVAEISKKWFRLRDSYGVEIAPGQDDIVILAAAVCIDQMAHGGH
jgi:uncharacterized protein YxjI